MRNVHKVLFSNFRFYKDSWHSLMTLVWPELYTLCFLFNCLLKIHTGSKNSNKVGSDMSLLNYYKERFIYYSMHNFFFNFVYKCSLICDAAKY